MLIKSWGKEQVVNRPKDKKNQTEWSKIGLERAKTKGRSLVNSLSICYTASQNMEMCPVGFSLLSEVKSSLKPETHQPRL